MISSDGLGQLNLNYLDPVSSHQKALGAIFHVNHDPTQPKAITWNNEALSPSPSSSTAAAATAAATSTPELAASITATPSSLASSFLQAATRPSSYTSTSTSTSAPLPAKSSSSSSGAEIASITLGAILGIVFATALFMFWTRRRRQEKALSQTVCAPSATPLPVYPRTFAIHEADAEVAATELADQHGRWELDSGKR